MRLSLIHFRNVRQLVSRLLMAALKSLVGKSKIEVLLISTEVEAELLVVSSSMRTGKLPPLVGVNISFNVLVSFMLLNS